MEVPAFPLTLLWGARVCFFFVCFLGGPGDPIYTIEGWRFLCPHIMTYTTAGGGDKKVGWRIRHKVCPLEQQNTHSLLSALML